MPEGPVATVDLGAIERNLARVRTHVPASTGVLAAVKANAYGHGAVTVARHLAAVGVRWFGVATPTEALELRHGGVTEDILVLSPAYERLPELVEANVAVTVAGPESLEALERAGLPARARVHVKVDTGMMRLGLPPREALELALDAIRSHAVELEAVWTHFARADEPSEAATRNQLALFAECLDALDRHGARPPLTHAANSAAAVSLPESAYDLVRPGIALYGYHAGPELAAFEPGLTPALTLSAPVTFVKRVAAGTAVSYGHGWRAPRDTAIATVRCGYADGYPRLLSNVGWAIVGDRRAAVAGRVCMDQLLLDVGDADIGVGDMVRLFGAAGPTASELADVIGTISYELLVGLAPRVARAYVQTAAGRADGGSSARG